MPCAGSARAPMPAATDFPGVSERRGAVASAAGVAGDVHSGAESEGGGNSDTDFGMGGGTGGESSTKEDDEEDMDDGMMGGPAAAGTVYTEATTGGDDGLGTKGTKTKDPLSHICHTDIPYLIVQQL